MTDEPLERGRQHLEHSTGRAVKRGKLTEDAAGRAARPDHASPPTLADVEGLPTWSSRRSSSRSRSSRRSSGALDEIVGAGRDPRHQHLVAVGHRDLAPPPRTPAGSSACTSSTRRRCRTSSRSSAPWSPSPTCSTTSPTLARALGKNPVVVGDKAGFIANALLFGYLNHAVVDVRGPATPPARTSTPRCGFGCGYPMGPLALLDLIGLDTAYEILDTMYKQGRDRLHAPAPILKQMVTAGLLGRKTGRGFYTYEAPDSPVVVADDADARRPTTSRSCATTSRRSASSAPARWPPASSRSSPRPATTCVYVGRSARQGRRRPRHDRALAGQGDPARQARGVRHATRCSAGSPAPPRSTTSPTSTSWSRRSPRTSRSRPTLFENLDEICKPGAILATTTSSLPVIALRQGDRRGRRTSSACTSSTRRR